MHAANPRRAAFDILTRVERDRAHAEPLIDKQLSGDILRGPDRGLLTELVYGVLRRRGTLDHLIGQFSSTKPDKLERSVLILLRLGLYQIFFLDRIPVSAAVNETVNLAKSLAPRASGLVNAILRRSDRERDAVSYPDLSIDPAGYISARYSHPSWLVEGWLRQLGERETEELAAAMAEQAPLTIRVNTLKTGRDELLTLLSDNGWTAAPTRFSPHGIHVISHAHIPKLPGFREGFFTVQDESSQLASLLLAPLPGQRVLDACAAPGGKATHLAQLMKNKGEVLACDISKPKLRHINETAGRLGIAIIRAVAADARAIAGFAGAPFDRILVDAPCSGLGVIRRNPEGKWWKTPDDVAQLAVAQRSILDSLAGSLAPGGVMLYSTCSTTVEENEEVIEDFLSRHHDFVLEDLNGLFPDWAGLFTSTGCFRSWPHRHSMDGFFAARLVKNK